VGTVYLGEREAKNGLRRLIAVNALVSLSPGRRAIVNFPVEAFPVGLLDSDRSQYASTIGMVDSSNGALVPVPQPQVRIISATEDPSDKSHFSFIADIFLLSRVI